MTTMLGHYARRDGTSYITGDFNMRGHQIKGVGDPTDPGDVANKEVG